MEYDVKKAQAGRKGGLAGSREAKAAAGSLGAAAKLAQAVKCPVCQRYAWNKAAARIRRWLAGVKDEQIIGGTNEQDREPHAENDGGA